MLAGVLDPEALAARIEASQGDEREIATTEGWYYIGQWRLAHGQRDAAREAFEKARAPKLTMAPEHVAAGFELQQLGARP